MPIRAGIRYALIVFAIGFALGYLRLFYLMPLVSDVAAVAIEMPLMLLASWLVCGWAIASLKVPRRFAARLAMGLTAFLILMALEWALGIAGFGRSPAEILDSYSSPGGALGLAGQILFALMPLVRR